MSDTNAPKRRKPVMTEMGRQLLQRERQRMAREQAALSEAMINEARARRDMFAKLVRANDDEENAFNRSVVRRISGVLATEGVFPMMDVGKGHFEAWTDFTQIYVRYTPNEDIRVQSAAVRGLCYHEGGHMRWSMPFDQLVTEVNKIQMGHGGAKIELTGNERKQLQRSWNALEDQRMETAVVSDSPRKAGYFTPVILTEHCSSPISAAANWPLLIWRRYLPRHIRMGARALWLRAHSHLDDAEAIAQRLEATVEQYVLATDPLTMWHAVVAFRDLLNSIRPLDFNLDEAGHTHQDKHSKNRNAPLEIPIDPSMIDDEMDVEDGEGLPSLLDDDQPTTGTPLPMPSGDDDEGEVDETDQGGAGSSKGDDDGGDDDEDEADGGSSTEDGGNLGGSYTPEDADHSTDKPLTQRDIDKAKADAEAERMADPVLKGDAEAYQQALENDGSVLPVYIGGVSNDPAATAVAESLAAQIEHSFQEATMDRQPAWVEGQRRGIVNVNRYVTRSPGDDEFFRQWVDDDQPGYNIAVSLLLDYSGSMHSKTVELAQCGYATKLACQKLEIPCTVVLWDHKATTLFDAQEEAQGLPTIKSAGSTDPSVALADLDNQRFDKVHHIVLMMTDGEWDTEWTKGNRTLAQYQQGGRVIIGFGFGSDRLAASLKKKGASDAFAIRDLMDIPKYLEMALIDLA